VSAEYGPSNLSLQGSKEKEIISIPSEETIHGPVTENTFPVVEDKKLSPSVRNTHGWDLLRFRQSISARLGTGNSFLIQ
jgi:hypothetical protein